MVRSFFLRVTGKLIALCREYPLHAALSAFFLCATVAVICVLSAGTPAERFDVLQPRDWIAGIAEQEIPSGEDLLRNSDYLQGRAVAAIRNTGADPETVLTAVPGLESVRVASSVPLAEGDYLLLGLVWNREDTAELLDRLNACPEILVAEPDYALTVCSVTDDPYSVLQWSYDNIGQYGYTPGEDINPEGYMSRAVSGEELVIVDIDLGVDYLHEDLKNMMWVNSLETPGNGIDDDGNGIVDDVYGANFANDIATGDPYPGPGGDHGSHTTGIMIAEANNGVGISGVAGGCANVRVMALSISSGSDISYAAAVRAYQYIYDMMTRDKDPVHVVAINDSWGGSADGIPYLLEAMINKVGELGALTVLATGNESQNFYEPINADYIADRLGKYDVNQYAGDEWDQINGEGVAADRYRPSLGGLDSDYVIRVAASNGFGDVTDFSNVGYMYTDIAAPGADILSTVSSYVFQPANYTEDQLRDLCAVYMTEGFNFRVNPSDPYGTNDSIAVVNNVKNCSAFTNVTGDSETSVNFVIRNAQANMPYLVELPYTLTSLAGEQDPVLSFSIKMTEGPDDWVEAIHSSPHFKCWDSPADEDPMPFEEALSAYVYAPDDTQLPSWNGMIRNVVWSHDHYTVTDTENGDRVFRLYIVPAINGDLTVSLDNFAVSKGAAGEETKFGKYEFMNGTSMATPTVTGAAALLAATDPSLDTALKLKEAVLNHTRQVSSLDNLVNRSALLDLNSLQDYYAIPQIHTVTYKDGTVTVTGEKLGEVTSVTVDGTAVTPVNVSDSEIVLNYPAIQARDYSLKVTAPAGYSTGVFMGYTGEKYLTTEEDYDELANLPDYNFTTDGESVYTLDHANSAIRRWIPDPEDPLHLTAVETIPLDFSEILDGKYEEEPENVTALYSLTPTMVDSFFEADGHLYFTVNDIDTEPTQTARYEMDYGFRHPVRSQLVDIDLSTGKQTVRDLPEGLFEPAVAAFNGELILAGGYDTDTDGLSRACYIGDGTTWRRVADLPEERAFGKLTAAGGKLYYTGGADETASTSDPRMPSMLVWNGVSWADTGVRLNYTASMDRDLDRTTYTYYQCGVSPLRNGLLFTDRVFTLEQADGTEIPMGDTVRYDTATGALTVYPWYYHEDDVEHCRGLVVGDRWRGMSLEFETYRYETDSYDGLLYYNYNDRYGGRDRSFPLNPEDVVTDDTYSLRVVLTSDDGNVSGFTFRILSGGREIGRVVTDKYGIAILSGLPAGTYTVEELPDASKRYSLPVPQNAELGAEPVTTVTFRNRLLPNTGDTASPCLWLLLLTASAALSLLLWRKRPKAG